MHNAAPMSKSDDLQKDGRMDLSIPPCPFWAAALMIGLPF